MKELLKLSVLRPLLPGVLLILGLSWLFSLPILTHYPDHVVSRSYHEDLLGQDTIESVQQREFKPFSGPLFLGNQLRPLWIKLTLIRPQDSDLVLHVQNNQTQHVEVWVPSANDGWQSTLIGVRHPFSARQPATLTLATRVEIPRDRPVTLYLRVITPSTPFFAFALTEADAQRLDNQLQLFTGLFMGIGLILVVFSTMAWLVTRDALWGLDVLMNLAGLFMLSLMMGLTSKVVWPDSSNWISQIILYSNCLYLVLVSMFFDRLLRVFILPSWMRWSYWVPLLMLPLNFWWIHTGHGDRAMFLNNSLILMQGIWSLFIIWRMRHADTLLVMAYRFFNLGLVIYLVWWGIAMVLRVQTGNLSTLYPMLPSSMFTMVMLLVILMRHTQLRMQAAQKLHLDKLAAEQQLRFEQQRHEETSSFLGMVLHEVKSPLNYIRMATSNMQAELASTDAAMQQRMQRIHASVDTVDNVLQRTVDVDLMEQNGLTLSLVTIHVGNLIQSFVAQHPARESLHLVGDLALRAETDPDLLWLMLRNLVDNAFKYSPVGAMITLRLARPDSARWCIEVRNPVGQSGFPEPSRIFQKFYRAPGATGQSGMGLGLYWVHGVASRMGGEVRYMAMGAEVVFTLCLPG